MDLCVFCGLIPDNSAIWLLAWGEFMRIVYLVTSALLPLSDCNEIILNSTGLFGREASHSYHGMWNTGKLPNPDSGFNENTYKPKETLLECIPVGLKWWNKRKGGKKECQMLKTPIRMCWQKEWRLSGSIRTLITMFNLSLNQIF